MIFFVLDHCKLPKLLFHTAKDDKLWSIQVSIHIVVVTFIVEAVVVALVVARMSQKGSLITPTSDLRMKSLKKPAILFSSLTPRFS